PEAAGGRSFSAPAATDAWPLWLAAFSSPWPSLPPDLARAFAIWLQPTVHLAAECVENHHFDKRLNFAKGCNKTGYHPRYPTSLDPRLRGVNRDRKADKMVRWTILSSERREPERAAGFAQTV